jgi:pimeloyl-ACP methyl ester carboxylesterase
MSSRRPARLPCMTSTHTLETPDCALVYDVRGPLPGADGRPPLFLLASPMAASGFDTLAAHFSDRTVVTYDPRGIGRSTRHDGRVEQTPEQQAEDLHRVVEAVGGRVDVFASSGGAVSALALVAAHPGDVATLVAHEPPLTALLPDAEQVAEAERAVHAVYHDKGWGHGMAAFIALVSWHGEFPGAKVVEAAPDPASVGLPTADDGSRDDPLLSGVSGGITAHRPDVAALTAAPTRVVIAVGEESDGLLTGRTSVATAAALGQEVTVFPGGHDGFLGGEFGQQGKPDAFAAGLREVLDGA